MTAEAIDVVGVGTIGPHGIGLQALGAALEKGSPLRTELSSRCQVSPSGVARG